MRLPFLLLGCLLACHATNLRIPDEEQKTFVPTYTDLDGMGDMPSEEPVETFKPEYAEFSASNSEDAPVGDGKTYKPRYKKSIPERVTPSVTKGFCAGVLEAIKDKKAPYFIHGEFTGEMRSDLLEQCGAQICNWGLEYRELVQTCPQCPTNCGGEFDPKDFFNSLLQDDKTAGTILSAIIHVQLPASGGEQSPTGAFDPSDYPAPPSKDGEGPKVDVTRGFCLSVLKGVKNKEAPYYVDGKPTGECRQDLIKQCGEHVCGWSNAYKDLLTENRPCDVAQPKKYLLKLLVGDATADTTLTELALYAGADSDAE